MLLLKHPPRIIVRSICRPAVAVLARARPNAPRTRPNPWPQDRVMGIESWVCFWSQCLDSIGCIRPKRHKAAEEEEPPQVRTNEQTLYN